MTLGRSHERSVGLRAQKFFFYERVERQHTVRAFNTTESMDLLGCQAQTRHFEEFSAEAFESAMLHVTSRG